MNAPTTDNDQPLFEPRWPTLTATVALSLWVAVLSLPMLSGQFLAGPYSDQHATGYAFRTWGAEQLRLTHHLPLWNPNLFGGMPFVAAMHGDIFYPTSWLRLILADADGDDMSDSCIHFSSRACSHTCSCGMLRVRGPARSSAAWPTSWPVSSRRTPSPGHDGKLFVAALLPLALLALVLAIRDAQREGYGLLAVAVVGLALLGPHFQMAYYVLIAGGLFALYLTFDEPTAGDSRPRVTAPRPRARRRAPRLRPRR